MKKTILLLVATAAIAGSVTAQIGNTDYRNKVNFGIKAGVNYSNVYDSQDEEFNAEGKVGLAAGVFVAIPIGELFGVQPEILFSQKGFKASGSVLGIPYKFTRTKNFIDIPILFQVKPTDEITFLAGPQYSYLLKQSDAFDSGLSSVLVETEFENENIRKNILGFQGGFDLNMQQLVFSGRVGWDMMKNNGDGTSETPRYKNVWYQATIGFRI